MTILSGASTQSTYSILRRKLPGRNDIAPLSKIASVVLPSVICEQALHICSIIAAYHQNV